ncbi:integrase core domain-containing protein [Halochromatium glycolicum]|uniref:integrase core domain-containing protein n=1 Tax=Halochromatium glycolicum TaxID=85075 RepID=UPI003B82DB1C
MKYEHLYLYGYETPAEVEQGLQRYIPFYNEQRPHSALDQQPPGRGPLDLHAGPLNPRGIGLQTLLLRAGQWSNDWGPPHCCSMA